MDTTTADRITAARVVAGYTTLVDAADRLGMHKVKYQKLEASHVRLNAVDADNLAKLFSVSKDLLLANNPSTDRDRLVSSIAEHIAAHAGQSATPGMIERLVQARQMAGFSSGRAAAAHFGWKPQTLGAHERGTANLSIERLISYGLAYRVRPEYLLYGEPPVEMPEIPGLGHWSDVRGSIAKSKPTEAVTWRWLGRQNKAGVATLVILDVDVTGLEKSKLAPMVLPSLLIGDQFVSPYGIRQIQDGKVILLIVDPTVMSRDAVILDNGVVRVEPHFPQENRVAVDPVGGGPKIAKDFYLGSLLAKVSIE